MLKINSPNLGLIDFIQQITLGRTWGKLSLWHKMKLVYALVFQAFLLPSAEDLNQMVSFTTHSIEKGLFCNIEIPNGEVKLTTLLCLNL